MFRSGGSRPAEGVESKQSYSEPQSGPSSLLAMQMRQKVLQNSGPVPLTQCAKFIFSECSGAKQSSDSTALVPSSCRANEPLKRWPLTPQHVPPLAGSWRLALAGSQRSEVRGGSASACCCQRVFKAKLSEVRVQTETDLWNLEVISKQTSFSNQNHSMLNLPAVWIVMTLFKLENKSFHPWKILTLSQI